jgi:hypothetical protein
MKHTSARELHTERKQDKDNDQGRVALAHALTAYLRRGKCASFFCCFTVFNDFSCCSYDYNSAVYECTSGRDTYGSKAAADGACALGTEVEREVLLLLVELPEVLALLLVRDRQNTRDALADSVAA